MANYENQMFIQVFTFITMYPINNAHGIMFNTGINGWTELFHVAKYAGFATTISSDANIKTKRRTLRKTQDNASAKYFHIFVIAPNKGAIGMNVAKRISQILIDRISISLL